MNEPAALPSFVSPSPFYGPPSPSLLRGKRRCHLVLIANPMVNHASDFHKIAAYIRQHDPKIHTTIIEDRRIGLARLIAKAALPTLAVSLVPLARFRPPRGRFLSGQDFSKSEEYSRLGQTGIAVPKWEILRPGETPDLSDYGSYVVTKPNRGMRGALVKIKRAKRVATSSGKDWSNKNSASRGPSAVADGEMLVQKFIYTGEWPINYRVTTLFGKVIHSFKQEASHERARLEGPDAFNRIEGERGVSIVASSKGCAMELNYDEETIRFGEAASAAFPEVPLLGFDIVREIPSGKLFILEANAVGYVWHFSSPMGLGMQKDFDFNFESQFDGLRKAAHILAAKTRQLAR